MDETLRRQYLQAMGITVWERRDPPRSTETVAAAAHFIPERPQTEEPPVRELQYLSAEPPPLREEDWPEAYLPELDSQPPYPDFPDEREPASFSG